MENRTKLFKLRKLISLFIIFAVFISMSLISFGADIKISIDGKNVEFTASSGSPFIDSANRTQVPLRVTMENAGCTVLWDSETRTAIVKKDSTVVKVPIGESYILVNGVLKANDTVAVIKSDRTYLPIRAVLEAFGADVSWNDAERTVVVKMKNQSQQDTGSQYAYKIETVNGKNTYKGYTIGDCHYEKLVFTNPNAALSRINSYMSGKCSEFINDSGDAFYEYGTWDIDSGNVNNFPYYCTSDIEDVYISDKYISILAKTSWYCGGVSNTDFYGCTFDVSTGNPVTVVDLYNGDAAKASADVKGKSLQHIYADPDSFFDSAEETIQSYSPYNYNFYYDSSLYVFYNTYEISFGACGPQIVKVF
ncbi:MAG: copper amine oxidase N-terminal domain-containing protein [Bacillota bacterium]|nr:copper amine oxidase N-terminal domain-containing protein [Bacillota bacterium]